MIRPTFQWIIYDLGIIRNKIFDQRRTSLSKLISEMSSLINTDLLGKLRCFGRIYTLLYKLGLVGSGV